ncbi:MAG TPA: type IV toxin-antitoxin system AbiEi family antitoxin domain-containing protein [Kribbella sp.]
MFSGVNTRLAATAARRGGWFGRRDAIEAGYSDVEIRAQLQQGRWIRLCRGAYAALDPDEGESPSWERAIRRHVRTAKAVYHRLGGRAVLSHQSNGGGRQRGPRRRADAPGVSTSGLAFRRPADPVAGTGADLPRSARNGARYR